MIYKISEIFMSTIFRIYYVFVASPKLNNYLGYYFLFCTDIKLLR